jgi:hypothetical protein
MADVSLRWHVTAPYHTDNGPLDVEHNIEEVAELYERIAARRGGRDRRAERKPVRKVESIPRDQPRMDGLWTDPMRWLRQSSCLCSVPPYRTRTAARRPGASFV